MKTLLGCLATVLLTGAIVSADEMDRDVKGKTAQVPAVTKTAIAGSELDKESPEQSHHYRWRGGWGVSVGYGGFGGGFYRPIGYGSYYGGGWGGYYRPVVYGGGWGGGWGGGGWGGGWGSHYRCW